MQVQVFVNSARDLKNVNWRNGLLKPYAVVYIDTSGKCSTKADLENGMNPVWNEKFTIPLRSTSRPETAILYIDVVHAIVSPNTKPLVGSAKLHLNEVLMEARANRKVARSLELIRPSGRPQGIVEIKIGVKEISSGNQHTPQGPLNNQPIPSKVEPQAQVQPQPQVQPKPPTVVPQPQVPPKPPRVVPQPQVQPKPPRVVPQPRAQPRPQIHPRPQAQIVRPQSQPPFQSSPRPARPIYGPGYRPVGPSPTQGLNMAVQNYQNVLVENNYNTNGVAYVDEQPIDGGLGGNGYDVGGGYDDGSALDLNGTDNGYEIDSRGFDNGYMVDSSGFDDGYGVDLSESMDDGGGFDAGDSNLHGEM